MTFSASPPRVVSGGSKIGKYNGGGPPEGDETKHHRRGDEHRNGGTLGLRVGHYSLYVRFCFRFRASARRFQLSTSGPEEQTYLFVNSLRNQWWLSQQLDARTTSRRGVDPGSSFCNDGGSWISQSPAA